MISSFEFKKLLDLILFTWYYEIFGNKKMLQVMDVLASGTWSRTIGFQDDLQTPGVCFLLYHTYFLLWLNDSVAKIYSDVR